jgi:hypothetical protein
MQAQSEMLGKLQVDVRKLRDWRSEALAVAALLTATVGSALAVYTLVGPVG